MLEVPDPSLPPPPNQRKVRVGAQTSDLVEIHYGKQCLNWGSEAIGMVLDLICSISSITAGKTTDDIPIFPLTQSAFPDRVPGGGGHAHTPGDHQSEDHEGQRQGGRVETAHSHCYQRQAVQGASL